MSSELVISPSKDVELTISKLQVRLINASGFKEKLLLTICTEYTRFAIRIPGLYFKYECTIRIEDIKYPSKEGADPFVAIMQMNPFGHRKAGNS